MYNQKILDKINLKLFLLSLVKCLLPIRESDDLLSSQCAFVILLLYGSSYFDSLMTPLMAHYSVERDLIYLGLAKKQSKYSASLTDLGRLYADTYIPNTHRQSILQPLLILCLESIPAFLCMMLIVSFFVPGITTIFGFFHQMLYPVNSVKQPFLMETNQLHNSLIMLFAFVIIGISICIACGVFTLLIVILLNPIPINFHHRLRKPTATKSNFIRFIIKYAQHVPKNNVLNSSSLNEIIDDLFVNYDTKNKVTYE